MLPQGQLFVRPRKANWDLKRDVVAFPPLLTSAQPRFCSGCCPHRPAMLLQEKKLEKLEKRTQRAILDLIQQKLKEQTEGSDNINLNDVINKGAKQQEDTED